MRTLYFSATWYPPTVIIERRFGDKSARDEEIKSRRRDRKTYRSIAEEFGLSVTTIFQVCSGLYTRRDMARRNMDIYKYYLDHPDKNRKFIAKKFGLGYQTLCRIINGEGVTEQGRSPSERRKKAGK